MKHLTLIMNVLIGAMAGAVLMIGGNAMAETETPDYELIESVDGGIEIREYPSLLIAEVTVTGTRGEATNKAFNILAAFIFGENTPNDKIAMTAPVTQRQTDDNQSSEKIAMTAPVTQSEGGSANTWDIAFIMPSKYTMETLPKPNDPRIRIEETDPYRAAAIRFSGRWTDDNFNKHNARLTAFLASRDMAYETLPTLAYYDGPFKPFFLRRNEIIYRLVDAK
ncbi:MAG: heme-binding protein [Pseudomonadota bacterium]